MKRSSTDSFILELPLKVSQDQNRILLARLELARRLYNAVLGESLKRLRLMRESKKWQKARFIGDKRERSFRLHDLCREFAFTSESFSAFGTACKNNGGWNIHLGAHETQRISERAYAAVRMYSFGKRGRPRFKGKNRPLRSVEAKTNVAGIRWKKERGIVEWKGLVLHAMLSPKGRDFWQEEVLSRETKYCRIVWRSLNDERRWYIQLIQEGMPPGKETNSAGIIGLDIGPSTVAMVGEDVADLVKFCPTIEQPWKEMRRLQRKVDRSRRATNPDCFNQDGTWKKGKRQTVFSKSYKNTRSRIAETERKLASERKRSHGELANAILSHGNIIQIEKLSYKSFQKLYGRSVKLKAPSMFINLLARKAESAGGALKELNTKESNSLNTTMQPERLRKNLSLRDGIFWAIPSSRGMSTLRSSHDA